MDYKVDKNGKKIAVQQFSNLKEKLEYAQGYIEMFNSMAASEGKPQVDVEVALKKIRKQHNKFYGDSKYDGRGNLKNA